MKLSEAIFMLLSYWGCCAFILAVTYNQFDIKHPFMLALFTAMIPALIITLLTQIRDLLITILIVDKNKAD